MNCTTHPKFKAALAVAYGAGLRVSEVASLKVSDIDSERMSIRDLYAMLSPVLLEHLRDAQLDTTARYTQIATDLLKEVISALGATTPKK